MKSEDEKKGLFGRLTKGNKNKKDSCCCNFEIEEITDKNDENKKEMAKEDKDNSCCQ
ncbi:MAG: hypothetical protein AWM53_00404 [Candidatus Dichloromethanomonas elyunquensis]|nr:MAG: hypothetical protein AWM53_00404 [Candidatus Dichloromethanomonas elyunquensis]